MNDETDQAAPAGLWIAIKRASEDRGEVLTRARTRVRRMSVPANLRCKKAGLVAAQVRNPDRRQAAHRNTPPAQLT
jgi:hypothetical protein